MVLLMSRHAHPAGVLQGDLGQPRGQAIEPLVAVGHHDEALRVLQGPPALRGGELPDWHPIATDQVSSLRRPWG